MADRAAFEDEVLASPDHDVRDNGYDPHMTHSTSLTASSDYSATGEGKCKAKVAGRKSQAEKKCCISDCPNKAASSYTACADHKKVLDAMLKQAGKAGQKAEVIQLLANPSHATRAVHSFQSDNRLEMFPSVSSLSWEFVDRVEDDHGAEV